MPKEKSPFKMLMCSVEKDKLDSAKSVLKNAKEQLYLSFLADGVELEKSDMFGWNRKNEVVLVGLVRAENATQTLQGLDLLLCPDNERSFGIAFTSDITSMSREMLEYFITQQKENA